MFGNCVKYRCTKGSMTASSDAENCDTELIRQQPICSFPFWQILGRPPWKCMHVHVRIRTWQAHMQLTCTPTHVQTLAFLLMHAATTRVQTIHVVVQNVHLSVLNSALITVAFSLLHHPHAVFISTTHRLHYCFHANCTNVYIRTWASASHNRTNVYFLRLYY